MNWLSFAIISVLGAAISNVLRRVVMKGDKSDALASTILFQFLGFAMILIFTLFHGFVLPPLSTYPLNFIAEGVLWGLSSLFIFKAAKTLEASEITIIATISTVVTIATAVFFLHEGFNIFRLIGVILILMSVVLVSFQKGKMHFNKGVLYILGYCICAGIAVTNDTFLLQKSEVYSFLVIGWLSPGLFLILISPQSIKKLGYFFHGERFKNIFLMTLFYCAGGVAFYLALATGGLASQVSPIEQTSTILTVIIAALFLNERDHLGKKCIAAVLVMIGVLLLR